MEEELKEAGEDVIPLSNLDNLKTQSDSLFNNFETTPCVNSCVDGKICAASRHIKSESPNVCAQESQWHAPDCGERRYNKLPRKAL